MHSTPDPSPKPEVSITRKPVSIPGAEAVGPGRCAAFQAQTSYTSLQGNGLIQDYNQWIGSDVAGAHFMRTSGDNGRSWSIPTKEFDPQPDERGGFQRRGESTFFLSLKTGLLYRFFNLHYYARAHFTSDIWWNNRIMMQCSRDAGKNFGRAEALTTCDAGPGEWARGIAIGKSALAISFSRPFSRSDGAIIVPVQQVPPLRSEQDPVLRWRAACLVGIEQEGGIEWRLSQAVALEPEKSVRGIFEPAIVELKGGRLLMVARGSNTRAPEMKGYKWRSHSDDGGFHWSPAVPLALSDGTPLYSPSSGSALLRQSGGKVYWVGNLCDENPDGNRPRFPLWIAELDEVTLTLRKESLMMIDHRTMSDSPWLQLSNFRVYEDRETAEIVVHLARVEEQAKGDFSVPLTEYRIALCSP